MTPEQIGIPLDFVSVDVTFISLSLVLPVAASLLREGGEAVCLVKPQFEAGREKVGKNGVVRDPATHTEGLEKALSYAEKNGFSALGLDFSPVRGPKGNIEYLMYLKKAAEPARILPEQIPALVERSHREV